MSEPENVAVWHLDDEGEAQEPSESDDDDVGESYTNWKEES